MKKKTNTNKLILESGKPAVESLSIWGSVLALSMSAFEVFQDPTIMAIVPPHLIPYLGALGAVLAILGRVKSNKKISSIF